MVSKALSSNGETLLPRWPRRLPKLTGDEQSEPIYQIPKTTKENVEDFKVQSAKFRGKPQAKIYIIDQKQRIIRAEDNEVYGSLEDLATELPESSPRFVFLHCPVTLRDGRKTERFVLVYWLPENCNPTQRMSYAAMVNDFKGTFNVGRVFEVENADGIRGIADRIAAY
ncbi:hypothetical protein N7468_001313 [Penicillium chermesinum]|uniref:ADF-H domain-containing protein n=1 Tax=Penicillium chermesinum TaxID=63820 RepID=A0A9W9PGJ6_9EURO|nr:uncharacterized protein N7468_001313 [Penicillium chermesinum]KAJ5246330.1 hypothetical protein N7468_001313 [Penicillium chermesinum]KAJ6144615.1 hypothetical protein N7470_008510 [Penicillium chermesinum]